jgi:TPR repeat protein
MRRQDIQMLSAARQGDVAARCEVGRRYLRGSHGFPQHPQLGIEYLTHASVKDLPKAARLIAESLPLDELLLLQQGESIRKAALAGSVVSCVKLGAWLCTTSDQQSEGIRWLERAAAAGHRGASAAVAAMKTQGEEHDALLGVLRALSNDGNLNGPAVALIAASEALQHRDLPRLSRCLAASMELATTVSSDTASLVVAAVRLAEETNDQVRHLSPARVEASLALRCARADPAAAYVLGRALCGIACGGVAPAQLVGGTNLRKGVALLLRAGDGGFDDAWLHLYRLHADHRSSVANQQIARYFLEKAAAHGKAEAQRKLGALILRESSSLDASEQAISWLHKAASQGDPNAKQLLNTLVLPVAGRDDDAAAVVDEVQRDDPWLAARLRLSRDFGLTKLEGLTVNPAEGLRAWGLVVAKNPFIVQSRLAAPRAVPALSTKILGELQRVASFFEHHRQDSTAVEGDLRRRSLRLRRAFDHHHLDEAMFFATATSSSLDSLRQGPKWAYRAKLLLRLALVA